MTGPASSGAAGSALLVGSRAAGAARTIAGTAAELDDRDYQGRFVEVVIRGLRRKLGPDASLIRTVRGVGYRFEPSGV